MDTELRHTDCFKLYWAHVAQRLMQALPIVEHLDEFEHGRLRGFAGVEVLVMYEFILERAD